MTQETIRHYCRVHKSFSYLSSPHTISSQIDKKDLKTIPTQEKDMSIASLLDLLVQKEESKKTDSFLSSLNPLSWSSSSTVPNSVATGKKIAQVKHKSQNAFNDQNLDMVVTIASFLTAKEIHTFRLVDRFTKHVFNIMAGDFKLCGGWNCFWEREILRQFGAVLPTCSEDMKHMSSIVKYLTYQQRVVESEYKHFMSAENFYICFHEYCTVNKQPGIIGMVCDVGYLEDPVVAAVLSRKRYMTMLTVLTNNECDVHRFKKAMTTSHEAAVSRIRSFLPVMSAKGILVDSDLERVIGSNASSSFDIPGFIGYAVKLIQLRKEHEHMRYSVFWGLFRDLMVFQTRELADRYGATLTLLEHSKFWFTCVDDYTLEELDSTYPRFQSMNYMERDSYVTEPPRVMKRQLERQISGIRYSHSIAKCTY